MKVVYLLISLILTIALIIVLDRSIGKAPAFGKFLSPQHGFWQNADPAEEQLSMQIDAVGLTGTAEVFFDERMVPHVFAGNDHDLYYLQGYLHAKFRLWQMEFQTIAAGGRLSEILGAGPDSAYLNNDRSMRRMGMVFGAKRALQEMEKDPLTRKQLQAYTAGVNGFLATLTQSTLPLEYRLLNYYPEKWSNLKTALLLKYMSYDLTGSESDIEYTNARSFFSAQDFNKLYPVIQDSADPIIPRGTLFAPPAVATLPPASADSLYYTYQKPAQIFTPKTDKDNGSNNWAAAGSKTKSGRPILCNDPHLGLNLPSLWFEMQLTAPGCNVYGVTLPGAPAVIIGFNDSVAWGITNAGRDVLDFYEIKFNDATQSQYWYNGKWTASEMIVETYEMNDGSRFIDTVAYTVFGPVMYDKNFNGRGRVGAGHNLAIRWKAHDPSNEFKTFYQLNRANNYDDYHTAIKHFRNPGQNFAFAAKSGDIAIWQQGEFPAKWYKQGDFIMPGSDSSYQWRGSIPQNENPHIINPERGFISSANQIPVDTSYPYYLGGDFDVYRGALINRKLTQMNGITPEDMQKLQNENYNLFAETAVPFLLSNTIDTALTDNEKKYLEAVKSWNLRNDNSETGATIFTTWFEMLEQVIWNDELERLPKPYKIPESYTLIEALLRDSAFVFIDDITTPEKETIQQGVTQALKRASATLGNIEKDRRLEWSAFKDAGIRHLLRIAPLSRLHLNTGGGVNVINATKQFHGPSWKMVVHLTDETEAYGIYPGGQHGNPGNREYDAFVDDWADGKYYALWMMKTSERSDRRVRHNIQFRPAAN